MKGKIKKLAIGRARELVKRELGISAATLTASPELSENPNLPYYSMNIGTKGIQVHTTGNSDGNEPNEMIVLTIVHENSTRCTHEYFYADTLEFAAEYTEYQFWNDLRETVGENDIDKICKRTLRDARDACEHHFYGEHQEGWEKQ